MRECGRGGGSKNIHSCVVMSLINTHIYSHIFVRAIFLKKLIWGSSINDVPQLWRFSDALHSCHIKWPLLLKNSWIVSQKCEPLHPTCMTSFMNSPLAISIVIILVIPNTFCLKLKLYRTKTGFRLVSRLLLGLVLKSGHCFMVINKGCYSYYII